MATGLADQDYEACRTALIAASPKEKRITVAHVVEGLPRHARPVRDASHARTCMCEGRGWIEVEQHDSHGSWWAWDHCPNGPRTGFVEVDA